jgi:hypothetical protein
LARGDLVDADMLSEELQILGVLLLEARTACCELEELFGLSSTLMSPPGVLVAGTARQW